MSTLVVTALRVVCLAYLTATPPQGDNIREAGEAENDAIIIDDEFDGQEAAIIGVATKSNQSGIEVNKAENQASITPDQQEGDWINVTNSVNTGRIDKSWWLTKAIADGVDTSSSVGSVCPDGRCEACYFLSKFVVPKRSNRSVGEFEQRTAGKVVFRGISKKTPFSYDPISVPMGYPDDDNMLNKIPMGILWQKLHYSIEQRFPKLWVGPAGYQMQNTLVQLEFHSGKVETKKGDDGAGGTDGYRCEYEELITNGKKYEELITNGNVDAVAQVEPKTLADAVKPEWKVVFDKRRNITTIFERTYYPNSDIKHMNKSEYAVYDPFNKSWKPDFAIEHKVGNEKKWTLFSEDLEGQRQLVLNQVITFPPLVGPTSQPAILMKIITTKQLVADVDKV